MYCFLATQISLLINQRNPQTSSHENKTTNPLAEKKKEKERKKEEEREKIRKRERQSKKEEDSKKDEERESNVKKK